LFFSIIFAEKKAAETAPPVDASVSSVHDEHKYIINDPDVPHDIRYYGTSSSSSSSNHHNTTVISSSSSHYDTAPNDAHYYDPSQPLVLSANGHHQKSSIYDHNELHPHGHPHHHHHHHHEPILAKLGRYFALFACIFAFHINLSTFTVFEVIGTPMTELDFSWHVMQNGILFLGCALCSILGFVILTLVNRYTGDRLILVISSFVMAGGYLFMSFVPLPLWRFLVSAAIVALALPMGQALTSSLITKLVPKTQQGITSGLRDAAGTFSRIIAPLWGDALFIKYGSMYVFFVCSGMVLVSAFVHILAFKWLVPMHKPPHPHGAKHVEEDAGGLAAH